MTKTDDAKGSGWASAAANYCRTHPSELLAYILDACTAVLVVAVQDVAFKQVITACAALSLASALCNWHAHTLGQRVIFPKSMEVMVPAICVALVVPAWLHEAETHRVVYIVICGTASLTMLATVLLGRSFAIEYFMDWYPEPFWGTPLVTRLASRLAWTWIITQAMMAGAAMVVAFLGSSNQALYITMNYVLQLVPLAISIIATIVYPKVLKRRWGYDPSDPSTGYPPEDRATLDASLLHTGGGGGKADRAGSTRPLLGSWLLLGHGRGADALAAAEAGRRREREAGAGEVEDAKIVIGPAQTPARRGEPRVSASASFSAAGERPLQCPNAAPAAAHSHST